jgi:hypothetical protein
MAEKGVRSDEMLENVTTLGTIEAHAGSQLRLSPDAENKTCTSHQESLNNKQQDQETYIIAFSLGKISLVRLSGTSPRILISTI